MRAFLAFTYLSNHTLGEAPPPDTADHHFWPEPPSQKTCLFNLVAGESHPSRLRASISSLVTASASRLPNFTFPSLPVRQWVLISHRTPARAPRPDILTFSTPRPARLTHPDREYFPPVGCWWVPPGYPTLPFRLYLSNSASLDLPLDAGASSPARQPYLSNLLLNEAHLSDTAILKPVGRRREPPGQTALPFQTYCSTRLTRPTRRFWNQSDVGESLRDRQLSFSILRPARPTQPRCRLTARPSDPLNFAFLSKPIRLGEPRSPDGRRREHSRPDNLFFSSPRSTRLTRPTRRFWNHSQTSARAFQPDNLTFPSSELGKVYPSDTAIAEATVGRRREPPSQTILPFKVPCSARLTRPTRQLLKSPSDVGESLPARQTHPFRLLAPRYRTPSNATCPAVHAILAFSPLPTRFNHPTHEYWSHVGRRKSLPAGQPHLFLLRQRS